METTVKEKLQGVSVTSKIATGWASYVTANRLKRGTQTYYKAMHAYVNGCNTVLPNGLPPIVQIYVMSGRDLMDLPHPEVETA